MRAERVWVVRSSRAAVPAVPAAPLQPYCTRLLDPPTTIDLYTQHHTPLRIRIACHYVHAHQCYLKSFCSDALLISGHPRLPTGVPTLRFTRFRCDAAHPT